MIDAPAESPWGSFRRHLSPEALAAFQKGLLHAVLTICLDAAQRYPTISIHLRGDTIDVYEGGSRIAGLAPGTRSRSATLTVADAYLRGTPLARYATPDFADTSTARRRSKPCVVTVNDRFVKEWHAHIDSVVTRSREAHDNPEGRWEARVLAANQAGTSVEFLDRQVQATRRSARVGRSRRLDAIALARVDDRDALIAVELKQKEDPRIWELYDQTTWYLVMLGGEHHELRPDVAESYQQVAVQRALLGLPSVAPGRIQPNMPMYGLVVLADYNPSSTRLADAVAHAARREAAGGRPIYAHLLDGNTCVLPAWPWTSLSQYSIADAARKRQEQQRLRQEPVRHQVDRS